MEFLDRRTFIKTISLGTIMLLTKNFTSNEMACTCCGKYEMDDDFMRMLQTVRDEMQRPLTVTSGYRCPKYNASISKTGKAGPHTLAKAADILISGADAMRLFEVARKVGMSGIGLRQKGPHNKRFLHVDSLGESYDGPRPHIWTY
jgi:zinc D-Ala-D-Ala carboxypeptidase